MSVDGNYLHYFGVMLSTLVANTAKSVEVFVLHGGLTEEQERFIRARFPEVGFNFIVMDPAIFEGFPTVKRYPKVIYYRIFAPLLLPKEVERVLYLDCDLVLHNSIDGFYNEDFGGNFFIACTHTLAFMKLFNRLRLKVKRDYVYMNTGVVLMNVSALREALDADSIREFTVKQKSKLILFDQDVLYKFYGNRVLERDCFIYNLSDRQFTHRALYGKLKVNEKWVETNNVIVHYIGANKPWKKDYMGKLKRYYTEGEKLLLEREKAIE